MSAVEESRTPDADADRRARFTGAYRWLYIPVTGYVMRRVDTPEDAAEIVAETFLVLWRRFDDAPAGDALRPWTFGIARHVMANQRRGERRRGELGERLHAEYTRLAQQPADPADSAVDGAQLRDAFATLAPADQELLRLIAWEGLTAHEAAAVLGVPHAAARLRLHRARRRLQRALESGDQLTHPGVAGHASEHQQRAAAQIAKGTR